MKGLLTNMVKALSRFKIFNEDIVDQINDRISSIEDLRWTVRNTLSPGRGIDGSTCRYKFCGHAQMPIEIKEFLKTISPKYDEFKLAEIAINKYDIGDYIGKHKDRHYYRKNLVISLQEKNDGIYIDDTDEFIEDKLGQCVMIEGIGPAHSVPPVKSQRFTLIYLYE